MKRCDDIPPRIQPYVHFEGLNQKIPIRMALSDSSARPTGCWRADWRCGGNRIVVSSSRAPTSTLSGAWTLPTGASSLVEPRPSVCP